MKAQENCVEDIRMSKITRRDILITASTTSVDVRILESGEDK